jgi:hypothetical protein
MQVQLGPQVEPVCHSAWHVYPDCAIDSEKVCRTHTATQLAKDMQQKQPSHCDGSKPCRNGVQPIVVHGPVDFLQGRMAWYTTRTYNCSKREAAAFLHTRPASLTWPQLCTQRTHAVGLALELSLVTGLNEQSRHMTPAKAAGL